jgi:ketosteroid isomerase-like protein
MDAGRLMSQENVDIVRRATDHFMATGEPLEDAFHPEFVWDMSTFSSWPEQQTYPGLEGARQFLADWTEQWDDWVLEVEDVRDAGDRVVMIMNQRGRSKATSFPAEMRFAQVYTVRDGKQIRMQMYASPAEALQAVGLLED